MPQSTFVAHNRMMHTRAWSLTNRNRLGLTWNYSNSTDPVVVLCTIGGSQNNLSPASGLRDGEQAATRDPVVLEAFRQSLNGTWDLMVSFSDVSPYTAKRFEPGECY
jgi:hypothetical protein